MLRLFILAAALLIYFVPASAEGQKLKIIAAENFYGDIAKQIGGIAVEVKSVLSNPGQDPHLFEASPSLVREVADADLVIFNGAGYDPWMDRILAAAPSPKRRLISVAELTGRKPGDNPHVWYDVTTVEAVAIALQSQLQSLKPESADMFKTNNIGFEQSLAPIADKVSEIFIAHAGLSVAATEPVFGYMLDAMGLNIEEKNFQLAVMNDVEPSVSDIAKFEDDLKSKRVKLLVYNKQATDPVADKFMALAQSNGIPVIAVTETMPEDMTYQEWLTSEIDAVAKALGPAP
jgi:zinc/manganese transport system substrate-binding protein